MTLMRSHLNIKQLQRMQASNGDEVEEDVPSRGKGWKLEGSRLKGMRF